MRKTTRDYRPDFFNKLLKDDKEIATKMAIQNTMKIERSVIKNPSRPFKMTVVILDKKTINKILKDTMSGCTPMATNIGNKTRPPPKPTIIDTMPTMKITTDNFKI